MSDAITLRVEFEEGLTLHQRCRFQLFVNGVFETMFTTHADAEKAGDLACRHGGNFHVVTSRTIPPVGRPDFVTWDGPPSPIGADGFVQATDRRVYKWPKGAKPPKDLPRRKRVH